MKDIQNSSSAAECLGKIGLPAPVKELAARKWDAIVVGAGHNGLACAAYLAQAGQHVLVLEARERIGGACTIEEAFPGVKMSPCAYLAGLLHPLVVKELDLPARGFEWSPAVNGLFVPFLDGSSIQLWDDDQKCDAEVKRFAPGDLEGFRAMCDVIRRMRNALRPSNQHDMWIGDAPTREEIEDRLGDDAEARALLFEWSMAEYVEHYLQDERLQTAYLGQGGRHARHVGIRKGRDGHGFLLPMRRGARGGCSGRRRRSCRGDHSGGRGAARGRRTDLRASRDFECRSSRDVATAGPQRRRRVESTGRIDSNRRLHGQVECFVE